MKTKPLSKYSDRSTLDSFQFVFFCDRCGVGVKSERYAFETQEFHRPLNEKAGALLWTRQHDAAYARANDEALTDFNLCPVCGRRVCCDCFYVSSEEVTDLCLDCMDTKDMPARRKKPLFWRILASKGGVNVP